MKTLFADYAKSLHFFNGSVLRFLFRGGVCFGLVCCSSIVGFAENKAPIRYSDFGAKGDGKTDDSEAIAKAHQEANSKGLPVVADDKATYYISGASQPIIIQTNTDFGKAQFVIDDTKPTKSTAPVFEVQSKLGAIKSVATPANIKKSQTRIEGVFPSACVVILTDSNVKRFIREGRNQNNGSSQTDAVIVDSKGNIDPATPLNWDFEAVTDMKVYPIDPEPLVVKGGIFTTIANAEESISYFGRGIKITRSNVEVVGLEHRIIGEGDKGPPYGGFISGSDCANLTVKDTVVCGHKTFIKIGSAQKSVPMGSYDLLFSRVLNVMLLRCTQFNDIMDKSRWGVIGTNFCKNITYDACKLSRFDAHQGVTNATIRNSTLGHMGVRLTGFGTFLIENSTVHASEFIGLRPDYGSTWTGDIIIRKCKFLSSSPVAILGFTNDGTHNFGYQCQMPTRLIVEGLTIEDGKVPNKKGGIFVFNDGGSKSGETNHPAPFPYLVTKEVLLKDVTTTSGTPLKLSNHPKLFKDTQVEGLKE